MINGIDCMHSCKQIRLKQDLGFNFGISSSHGQVLDKVLHQSKSQIRCKIC